MKKYSYIQSNLSVCTKGVWKLCRKATVQNVTVQNATAQKCHSAERPQHRKATLQKCDYCS